jgi:hypothetical protein
MYVLGVLIGQVVPEGLAAMPPGPPLAAVLAELEPALVPNDDVVDALIAGSRQLAHCQAQVFALMNEVLHRLPFAGPGEVRRGDGPGQFAADEVRAALAWTRRAAERETDLAFVLVTFLPLVQEALSEGRIDRGKAVVFAEHLAYLTAEQAEAICRRLLPVAGGLTPWQLGERIRRLILELDPAYYERRYQKAITDRKVVGYLDENGAAVVTGSGLPAQDAAAALERIDQLARAVRRAGHPNTLDQLRADVFLGLLDGSLHHLSREQIIAALLARAAAPSAGGGGGAAREASGAGSGPAGAGGDARGRSPGGDDRDGDCDGDPGHNGPDDDPGDNGPGDNGPDDGGGGRPWPPRPGPAGAGVPATAAPPGVEIRVPLSTLLRLDDRAGEIPGWGPVSASVARVTVARQRRAQWRWVVVDAEGRLVSEGITRRRPTGHTGPQSRGGVVELQIPQAQLAELEAADGLERWARVIADIAAQHRERDDRAADLDAHPEDRFPRAALRRHVEIRDRHCTFRGCRTPARRADQDHTVDHARGGPTTTDDLGPACRHDHTLKTEGGWTLVQPEPGMFVWTSPLGRVYPVRPEPILPPAPDPVVREPDPWHDTPSDPTERPLDLGPGRRAPPEAGPEPVRGSGPLNWTEERPTGVEGMPPF